MRKGGGKSKGAEFERCIAKKLSLAMTKGKRDDIFWRSAMSGGVATVAFKKGGKNITQVGDITAIDPIGHKLTDNFVFECKRYKKIRWESLVYGKPDKGNILEFWRKLYSEAIQIDKSPILIIKENGKEPIACIAHPYYCHLDYCVISSEYFACFKVFWLSNFLKNIKKFL